MGQKEEEKKDGSVVAVKPKPSTCIASKAVDFLEWVFVKLMHGPKNPIHYFSGNFAPVDETHPLQDLPVKGHLPECLNGEFVRVGPNPKFAPVAGYHWFDGDGCVFLFLIHFFGCIIFHLPFTGTMYTTPQTIELVETLT